MKALRSIRLYIATLLCLFNVFTGVLAQPLPSLPDYYYAPPVWSPDGMWVATVTSTNHEVVIWDTVQNDPVLRLTGHKDKIMKIAWHPDGTQVATASLDQTARIWDANTGATLFVLDNEIELLSTVIWSPDATRIISMGIMEQPLIKVWDAATGKLLETHTGGTPGAVAFSPDNSRFAFVAGRYGFILDGKSFAYTETFGNSDERRNNMYALAWSSDGLHLVTGNLIGQVGVWKAQSAIDPVLQVWGNDHYDPNRFDIARTWVHAVTFTPDNRYILSSSADGTVRSWDFASGQLYLESKTSPNSAAAWSPYGGRLAYLGVSERLNVNGVKLADDTLQITVPLASLDLVKSIAAGCVVEMDNIRSNLDTLTTDALPDFVAQIKELPADAIPPACTADLIAVAEAIIGS